MLKIPEQGSKVLGWATEATHAVNAQNPIAGKGITVSQGPYGTIVNVANAAVPHPDSVPTATGIMSASGEGDDSETNELSGFATTYSLQRDEQNSFSLFRFRTLSAVENYGLSNLLSTDFVFRDRCSEEHSINKSPTVRYDNVYNLLSTAMFGKKVEISGDNALSVYPLADYLSGLSGDIPVVGGFSWGLNDEFGSLCAQIDHWHFEAGRLQTISSNVSSIILFKAVAEQV